MRTQGAEVGVRTKALPGLNSSISLFVLHQASELIFSGDAGDTEASRSSRRYGIELTNNYQPRPWLAMDADLALSHARFLGFDPEQRRRTRRSPASRRHRQCAPRLSLG